LLLPAVPCLSTLLSNCVFRRLLQPNLLLLVVQSHSQLALRLPSSPLHSAPAL
jgi:hypothetical protein